VPPSCAPASCGGWPDGAGQIDARDAVVALAQRGGDTTYSVNASSVSSNGAWKLKVIDDDVWGDGGDYGTLNGWSMTS
jgi:subtilisin-like proprotein convertase family protein